MEGELSVPSSPQMKVVFDMTHPQSPMRPKDKVLPADSTIQEGAETLAATSSGPTPSSSAETGPTSTSTETTVDSASAPPAPITSTAVPSEVPLPESRPISPEAPGTPARVASPAIASVFANGAGSTPPPLPRRAAARRAVPPPPGASGEVGSRPGTPLKKVAEKVEPKEEGGEGKVEVKEVVEKMEEKSEEKENVPEADKAKSQSEQKAADSESDDEFVDAIAGVASPQNVTTPAAEITLRPAAEAPNVVVVTDLSPALKPVEEANEKRDSIDTVTEVSRPAGKDEKVVNAAAPDLSPEDLEPSLATTALGGLEKHEDKASDDSDISAQEDGRDAKEVYVGEATWEERTWKEIVRLKEDMFWARVGGWRP